MNFFSIPYLKFSRKQWASFYNSPIKLTKTEIIKLKAINENLSLEEIMEIYLPLSHLLNIYISSNLHHQRILGQFFNTNSQCNIPYIIAITGSVAAGKSTTASVLKELLNYWPEQRTVDLVTTDGFLYPNRILKERGLMKKKGFPESYDIRSLITFISNVRLGTPRITAPIYSHLTYDIVPQKQKIISQPDVIIFEGLNILQTRGVDYKNDHQYVFVSDFIDFSIYIDAPEHLLQNWYINRFLKFCHISFSKPNSHFYHYSQLSEQKTISIANQLWIEINSLNLQQNILPARACASLILEKSNKHIVNKIKIRKQPCAKI